MKHNAKNHRFAGVLVLFSSLLFAVSLVLVLLFGARVLGAVSDRSAAAFDARTCVQYLAERVRHADTAGGVYIARFSPEEDTAALCLQQDIEGTPYITRIYWYDGAIYELFADASATLSPADGNAVLYAQALSFSLANDLLTISVTDQGGETSSVSLSPRAEGGAA